VDPAQKGYRDSGGGHPRRLAHGQSGVVSSATCAALLPRVRGHIVVQDDLVDAVISAIAEYANTGTIGDGKIWVSPVDSALRTRTGERDNSAI